MKETAMGISEFLKNCRMKKIESNTTIVLVDMQKLKVLARLKYLGTIDDENYRIKKVITYKGKVIGESE